MATAAPAVEQKGQKCPLRFPPPRSAQKWNWAARKISPNKRAKALTLLLALNIPMNYSRPKILLHVHRQVKLCPD